MNLEHVCCVCGHKWNSVDEKTGRGIIKAVAANKDGPYCAMCHHLGMAEHYALSRGFEALEGGVKKWRAMRSQRELKP